MNINELRKLSGGELDRMAAETRGLKWLRYETFGGPRHAWHDAQGKRIASYHPTVSLDQAAELEKFVIAKVGDRPYEEFLIRAGAYNDPYVPCYRADAKTRTIACLAAIGGGE